MIVGNTDESKRSVGITFVSSLLLSLLPSALPFHEFSFFLKMANKSIFTSFTLAFNVTCILPEKMGRGVRSVSQNPYPIAIYDQDLRSGEFSLRYSRLKMSKFTKKCMAIRTLSDTAFGCHTFLCKF